MSGRWSGEVYRSAKLTIEQIDLFAEFILFLDEHLTFDLCDSFWGSEPDWLDIDQLYNHYYNKFDVECKRNASNFFVRLDIGNKKMLVFYWMRTTGKSVPLESLLETTDFLSACWTYLGSTALEHIFSDAKRITLGPDIIDPMKLWRTSTPEEKERFLSWYGAY